MDKIYVEFAAGAGIDEYHSENYMFAKVENEDGEEIELFASIEIPEDAVKPDDYDEEHYPILKAEIIRQAQENGVDPETLKFWWD